MSVSACRSCGAPAATPFLDLGLQPLANNLLREEDLEQPEPRVPLRVFACPRCWLVQIADEVPPHELFTHYPYFSSTSAAMVAHAREAVDLHRTALNLGADSFVVEIASNDGYLLQHFAEHGVPCLGIEPATNVAAEAQRRGIDTRVAFFDAELADVIVGERGPADLVLANNVFAHAPDTNEFVAGLAKLLAPSGRAVLEFPYAFDMIDRIEFDTIYHEHVFYFTATALAPLFARHGLAMVDVEPLELHGGSLRLSIAHAGEEPTPRIASLLEDERARGVANIGTYEHFAAETRELCGALVKLLDEQAAAGHRLAAYGASAKGSTLLNACGIGAERLAFVADLSPHKQGLYTPGTHLPILPPEALRDQQIDRTLLLTWNFAEEIRAQQSEWEQAGGRFVVPLPRPRVLT
ncbi:MAG: class I SAM-dependent methyltransferase [bacterium]|nr:class I SAM-dependent methyltransferase [bacterium]